MPLHLFYKLTINVFSKCSLMSRNVISYGYPILFVLIYELYAGQYIVLPQISVTLLHHLILLVLLIICRC